MSVNTGNSLCRWAERLASVLFSFSFFFPSLPRILTHPIYCLSFSHNSGGQTRYFSCCSIVVFIMSIFRLSCFYLVFDFCRFCCLFLFYPVSILRTLLLSLVFYPVSTLLTLSCSVVLLWWSGQPGKIVRIFEKMMISD
jgi:hypothetical protein